MTRCLVAFLTVLFCIAAIQAESHTRLRELSKRTTDVTDAVENPAIDIERVTQELKDEGLGEKAKIVSNAAEAAKHVTRELTDGLSEDVAFVVADAIADALSIKAETPEGEQQPGKEQISRRNFYNNKNENRNINNNINDLLNRLEEQAVLNKPHGPFGGLAEDYYDEGDAFDNDFKGRGFRGAGRFQGMTLDRPRGQRTKPGRDSWNSNQNINMNTNTNTNDNLFRRAIMGGRNVRSNSNTYDIDRYHFRPY